MKLKDAVKNTLGVLLVAAIYLSIAVVATAQYQGNQRVINAGVLSDTADVLRGEMADSAERVVADSLARINSIMQANLEDSLLFFFDLWGSSETIARDMSGNNNHGVLVGFDHDATDGWPKGGDRDGGRRALKFDGDGDRVKAAVGVAATSTMWVEVIVQIADTTAGSFFLTAYKAGNDANDYSLTFFYSQSSTEFKFRTKAVGVGSQTEILFSDLDLLALNHFVWAFDGSNAILYVNGDSVSSVATASIEAIDSIAIGTRGLSSVDSPLTGNVCSFRTGDGSITANEISALYHQFRQQIQPGHPVSVDEDRELTFHDDITIDSSLTVNGSMTTANPNASITIGLTVGDYIQDTLDAVLDSALTDVVNGGHIFIRGGTYYISDGAVIRLSAVDTVGGWITISGEPGKTIIQLDNTIDTDPVFSSEAGYLLNRVEFRDLIFNVGNNTGLIFSTIAGTDSVTFRDCIFRNSTNLVEFLSSATVYAWRFIDCSFIGAQGLYMNGVDYSNARITGCEFNASHASGEGALLEVTQSLISGNKVTNASGRGLLIAGPSNIVSNNIISPSDSTDLIGISITGPDNLVTGNIVGSSNLAKIMMDKGIDISANGDRARVISNVIYGARVNGIETNGDNTMIATNQLHNCITGINFIAGTKSGHSENFFLAVGTNVTDGGTGTVAGDIRDLD